MKNIVPRMGIGAALERGIEQKQGGEQPLEHEGHRRRCPWVERIEREEAGAGARRQFLRRVQKAEGEIDIAVPETLIAEPVIAVKESRVAVAAHGGDLAADPGAIEEILRDRHQPGMADLAMFPDIERMIGVDRVGIDEIDIISRMAFGEAEEIGPGDAGFLAEFGRNHAGIFGFLMPPGMVHSYE